MKDDKVSIRGTNIKEIPIQIFERLGICVPNRWGRCYTCHRETQWIHVGVFSEKELSGAYYPLPEENEFAQNLRAIYHSNFEIPLCNQHRQEAIDSYLLTVTDFAPMA